MKALKTIVDIALNLFLILAVLVILLLFGVRAFSLTPYVVTSGSMEPVYPVGSVVYVKETPPEALKVEDDISFYLEPDVIATHRIREIYPESHNLQTYGINNFDAEGHQINDARRVDFDHIIGKVQFSIPIIGFVFMFIKTTQGKIAVIVIALAMLTISQILKHFEKEKTNERK